MMLMCEFDCSCKLFYVICLYLLLCVCDVFLCVVYPNSILLDSALVLREELNGQMYANMKIIEITVGCSSHLPRGSAILIVLVLKKMGSWGGLYLLWAPSGIHPSHCEHIIHPSGHREIFHDSKPLPRQLVVIGDQLPQSSRRKTSLAALTTSVIPWWIKRGLCQNARWLSPSGVWYSPKKVSQAMHKLTSNWYNP